MSEKDRTNAVVRHPEYREDLIEQNRLKIAGRNDEANSVLKWISIKWSLAFPPPIWQQRSFLCFEYSVPSSVEVVVSISADYPPLEVKGPSPWNQPKFQSYEEWRIWEHKHMVLDGRYLYVRVDVTDSEPNLMKRFRDLIETYKSCLPPQNERRRELLYSPWLVYDMYHHNSYDRDRTKIAMELSGSHDTDSGEFKAAWKRVDRAYKKACQMIREVGQQVADFPKTLTMGDDKQIELEPTVVDDIIDDLGAP